MQFHRCYRNLIVTEESDDEEDDDLDDDYDEINESKDDSGSDGNNNKCNAKMFKQLQTTFCTAWEHSIPKIPY